MLSYIRAGLLALIAAILVACGGGGGGGDSTPNFAGNYQISTTNLTANTCGGSVTTSIEGGFDTVVQNGRSVSLSDGAATGTVDADNGGFTVTTTDVIDGVTVVVTIKFRVTATGASTFAVQVNSAGSVGSVSCSLTYSGTATKI